MRNEDLFHYQDTLMRVTHDIHERCGVDVSVLWDDGKLSMVTGRHRVKVWNGLGSLEFEVEHEDLVQRGAGYQRFLDNVATMVRQKLSV